MSMFRLPEQVKPVSVRDQWILLTGREAAEYACPACGLGAEMPGEGPPLYCRPGVCGCPHPWPCASCDTIVNPVEIGGQWDRPDPFCPACSSNRHREEIRGVIERIIPSGLRAAARAFYDVEHRRELMAAIYRWVGSDRLGMKGGPSALLVYGSRGSGKSVGAAWAIAKAINDEIVQNALYVTEDDLIRAAVDQFSDASDVQTRSRSLLHVAANVPLLAIDELGSTRTHGYSDREKKELIRLLHKRLSGRMPTLLVSNLAPAIVKEEGRHSHLGWLDERIDSRFAGCGIAVECTGGDLRVQGVGGGQ